MNLRNGKLAIVSFIILIFFTLSGCFDNETDVPVNHSNTEITDETDIDDDKKTSVHAEEEEVPCLIGNPLSFVKATASTPKVSICDVGDSTMVFWEDDVIAELRENRFLRFRAKPENDHWLGTNAKPMDLGWNYNESQARGYTNESVEVQQDNHSFKITLTGVKEKVPGVGQINVLEGRWSEDKKGFEYILTSTLKGDLESWYEKSNWAKRQRNAQPLDYHSERISMLDRVDNNNRGPDLYDYVVYSNDGESWTGIPKLGVPRTMLAGTYFYDFILEDKGYMALVDAKQEGWIVQLLEATGDMRIEACWSWYDMHHVLENSIPERGSGESFELMYSLHFKPSSVMENKQILSKITEVPWKNLPNYQLPIFSKDNKFDKQFGGTDWTDPWLKTSYDAIWDQTVGYDDHYSVSIQKTDNKGAAWFGWFAGRPFEFESLKNKKYRFSAMVKTEGVAGKVRIGIGQVNTISPVYGVDISGTTPKPIWIYSEELSGDNDWTKLSIEYIAEKHGGDTFILDQQGPGKSWFDNVVIEPIGNE
jgi:hypothetical protein